MSADLSPQWVTVLGATGSIGASTLDVIRRHPGRYRVFALSGHTRLELLASLCAEFSARHAVAPEGEGARLRAYLDAAGAQTTRVLEGDAGLCEVAAHPEVDQVMAAIVGAAGLSSTLAAVEAGKRVLLANKESLVMAGPLFMQAVHRHQALLLPIDSEHNAIFQCMPPGSSQGLARAGVRRILLTGSGGPFRQRRLDELHDVTPDQACAHPNWSMGRKISVDSATMMNKGLEFIEACWLFDAPVNKVQVVVHPQSVIHSMVEYDDGSILAQLGNPDMRTPIAHAMAWPERISSGVPSLDIIATARLDFEAPDEVRFPCLRLAREAMLAGGAASVVLNAANEMAVAAFLEERMRFTAIPGIIEDTLSRLVSGEPDSIGMVKAVDHEARQVARELISRQGA